MRGPVSLSSFFRGCCYRFVIQDHQTRHQYRPNVAVVASAAPILLIYRLWGCGVGGTYFFFSFNS